MGLAIDGFTELVQDIQKLAAAFDGDAPGFKAVSEEALTAAAAPVLESAQQFVPVRPDGGVLKRALQTGKVKKRPEGKGGGYRIDIGKTDKGEDGYYAPFVEFGHGGPHGPAAPRPFLRPAFDAQREQANTIIRDTLRRKLDETIGK